MRFAYIDSQGKEVGIPTVDALRLRIALKAIVEDTVFYDASTERWAPAEEHEIFRTLRKELAEEATDEFVASPPAPDFEESVELELEEVDAETAATQDEHHDDSDHRFAISNAPTDSGAQSAREPASEDEPEVEVEGGLEEIGGGDSGGDPQANSVEDEVEAGDDLVAATVTDDDSMTPIGSSSWVDLDMEGQVSPVFDLSEEALTEEPEVVEEGPLELVPEMGGATEPDPEEVEPPEDAPVHDSAGMTPEGLTQDRHDFEGMVAEAGWGDEPPPMMEDLESTEVTDSPSETAPAVDPGRGPAEPPLPSREEVRQRVGAARADSGGPGPRSAPPTRRPARRRGVAPIAGLIVLVAAIGGGAWWALGREATPAESDPPAPPPVAIPSIPAELEPRMRELADEVRATSLAALRDLPGRVGVPAEPSPRWLAGEYLANASRFDDVETYWIEMSGFLRTMQVAEDSLFLATLDARLAQGDVDPANATVLDERIRAGFRATARDRGVVFQRARAVAEAASRLHAFLVENEDQISWEPSQSGLSADPVLEAVPATPEVGEEMWDLVGDITDSMDALEFLDRVTTERLVSAILERLSEIPVR